MSSYHRHSNISPPASEAPPELQEEELKALLLLWQENRASHQLRVQVLQLSGFVSLSIRKLHWTLSWDFPLQHETTEIWRYFHFDCEIVPINRNSFFVVVENFPKTEKKNRQLQIGDIFLIFFRCGNNFCASHRYAEAHDCTYDYKTAGRRLLQETNPIISAPKLPKIWASSSMLLWGPMRKGEGKTEREL